MTKTLPIPLGVRRGPDASGSSKGRAPNKSQNEKTMARDSFTCRCCGFESKRYQRVIPQNQVSPSAKEGDMITVCTFCELTANLDRAGLGGAGFLIWLPEVEQGDLNNIVRALYVARDSEDAALAKAATRTLEVLTARRAEAKKRLGTDDPLLLATALFEQLDDKAYAERTAKLEGIRFLPLDRYLIQQRGGKDINAFPQMMEYWKSPEGPYGKIPVSEWTKLFEQVSGQASA
jgi:intracellular multiplication protein IcmJ